MTSDVRFTVSVGDTITRAAYNGLRAREIELVTLNTIFSVLISSRGRPWVG